MEAVIRAWTNPGLHPWWHEAMKREVRDAMPILTAALDRLVNEN